MSLFQDLPAAVRRISDFLGRNLSDEAIKTIAEHCSFKTMKVNTMSNFSLVPKKYMDNEKCPFLRKGEAAWVEKSPTDDNTSTYCGPSFEADVFSDSNLVCVSVSGIAGDWKNHFSKEQLARFSSVIHKEMGDEISSLPWSLD